MHGATAWQPNTWARRSAYALDTATADGAPGVGAQGLAQPPAVHRRARRRPTSATPTTGPGGSRRPRRRPPGCAASTCDDVTMTRRVVPVLGHVGDAARPAHERDDDRGQLAALHGGLHGRRAQPRSRPPRSSTTCSGTRATRTRTSPASSPPRRSSRSRRASTTRSITGGSGTYGFQTLTAFVERRQAAGQGVILDAPVDTAAGHHLRPRQPAAARHGPALARQRPLDRAGPLLAGLQRQPRRALAAPRTSWSGVWRRDFASGVVLVNEPGMPSRTLSLGSRLRRPRRRPRSRRSRWPAGTGLLLRKVGPAPTPTPTPAGPPDTAVPVATATPAPRRPRRRSSKPDGEHRRRRRARATSVTVTVSRLAVSGRVKGAVSGYVHVTVQRKRGKGWVTVRRAKPNISKRGRFEGARSPASPAAPTASPPASRAPAPPSPPAPLPHPPPVSGSVP